MSSLSGKKLTEYDIKDFLKNYLFNKGDVSKESFLVTEFNISNFSRRVDMVLFSDKKNIAFEIKSDFDTLVRLKPQTEEYLKCFDKIIVVAAEKHIKKALDITPDNVGVWKLKDNEITIIRKGKEAKIKNKVNYIRMMTMPELRKISKNKNINLCDNKRTTIEARLMKLPLIFLRKKAIESIRIRYKKRGGNYYDLENRSYYFKARDNNDEVSSKKKYEIDKFIDALATFIK